MSRKGLHQCARPAPAQTEIRGISFAYLNQGTHRGSEPLVKLLRSLERTCVAAALTALLVYTIRTVTLPLHGHRSSLPRRISVHALMIMSAATHEASSGALDPRLLKHACTLHTA